LSAQDRKQQLATAKAEFMALERKEAALVWRYVEKHRGAAPEWVRADISPAAILGIE
jgi:hypothetical protein